MESILLKNAERRRKKVSGEIIEKKSELGQFFTPDYISQLLAQQFSNVSGEIILLDPGAGMGILTAAFVERILENPGKVTSCKIAAYEIEQRFIPYLEQTLNECVFELEKFGIKSSYKIINEDFIEDVTKLIHSPLFYDEKLEKYSHIITNPPYKKINNTTHLKGLLIKSGINTVNLYSAFVWLSMMTLLQDGEIVAITPRSFCNGSYYRSFRLALDKNVVIDSIHIFEKRNTAFSEENVLQENIILHLIKQKEHSKNVKIAISDGRKNNEHINFMSVPYFEVIKPNDPEKYIYIPVNKESTNVKRKMENFKFSLEEIGLNVSTGPVVDFRLERFLSEKTEDYFVPLIYPQSIKNGYVIWPINNNKKPKTIQICKETKKWLIRPECYVLVKRFTSKEEKRRIVAGLLLPMEYNAIGIENHVNYFFSIKHSMDLLLAKGLTAFLNSTLFDDYYRLFSGHTQINVADLRKITYPNRELLINLGEEIDKLEMEQEIIDNLVKEIICG